MTYLEKRLKDLGIDNIQFKRTLSHMGNEEVTDPLFEEDETGNIIINYFQLQGNRVNWKKPGTKNARYFIRKRLKEPLEGMKYWQEKGSGQYLYFTPSLINKFESNIEIDTLFVTEGEFKALKGSFEGIDIIGLPSIHGFYEGDIKGKINEDLIRVLKACSVRKIVFLTDADTLTVRWKKDKDLSIRQAGFYSAIRYFREGLQKYLDDNTFSLMSVFFMHINSKYSEDAKGLDDLFVKYPGSEQKKAIIEDLNKLAFSNFYFEGKNITDGKLGVLYNYFGLSDEQVFYETYKSFINDREFLFKKRRYEWNGKEVVYLGHEDVNKYVRIGTDWMKTIKQPNKNGDFEEKVIPWKIGEIQRDYKKYPGFMDLVPKYDAFINEPCWVQGKYNREISGCYNLCNPLIHDIKEGSLEITFQFLKHLFGGEGSFTHNILGDPFTVALDYLTIQFQYPKQMLPVPILVSKEQDTGKTTFMKWLQQVYGSNNVAILNNEQFKMKFNGHYISKFIIGIDESFLEMDKKSEKERLKQLATSDRAFIEFKGQDVKEIPYYGKLVMCSNDADKVMKIDEEDTRWFIVKVPQLTKKDPDMEKKLREEIPGWLYFIANRQIFHKRETRLWFRTEHILTEQFTVIANNTKGRLQKTIEEYVADIFMTYRVVKFLVSLKNLTERINKESKYKFDAVDVKYLLQDQKGMKVSDGVKRQSLPIYIQDSSFESKVSEDSEYIPNDRQISYDNTAGRCYEFRYNDWLDDSQKLIFESGLNVSKGGHDTILKTA
jgi:hypothetical protein